MGATKAVGHGVNSTPPPVRMERECHGPLQHPCPPTKRCRALQELALALERSVKRNREELVGISSVVGGTRKHEWVAGDKVRIAIGGGAHTTGVVVTLPANRWCGLAGGRCGATAR